MVHVVGLVSLLLLISLTPQKMEEPRFDDPKIQATATLINLTLLNHYRRTGDMIECDGSIRCECLMRVRFEKGLIVQINKISDSALVRQWRIMIYNPAAKKAGVYFFNHFKIDPRSLKPGGL